MNMLFVGAWVSIIFAANYSTFQAGNLTSFEKMMLLVLAILAVFIIIGATRLLKSTVRMRGI